MAKRTTIELSEQDLMELQTIARSTKAESRQVLRSRIILHWNQGKSFKETQQELGVSQMAINKWRKRFLVNGMEGLYDSPRSGKPPVLTAAQKAKVRAGFGAQNCQPALNLNRSTKLQVCTSARLTQNPC